MHDDNVHFSKLRQQMAVENPSIFIWKMSLGFFLACMCMMLLQLIHEKLQLILPSIAGGFESD